MAVALFPGLFALIAAWPVPAQSPAPHVSSDAGNIVIDRDGAKTKLTSSGMDIDPLLSPNGRFVVYTRRGRSPTDLYDAQPDCATKPHPDELRRTDIDGSGDKVLLTGREGDPEQQLCDFQKKQFSSDGRRLYFLSQGWATSGALHVFDMRSGEEHFVLPANDILVLSFCADEHKDDLAVAMHRYFLFGGSYDWYWLYDPDGKKELGPLGDDFDDVAQAARSWCASKPKP